MPRYGMVIDLDKCYGCRACMVACKIENNTPESHFWMYVYRLETGSYPYSEVSFLPRPCMHCDNAPCVRVCPVSARYKEPTGIVATDWDRCIGCRYCAVACPYGVNYFNWADPKERQYIDTDDEDLAAVTGGANPPYKNPDLDSRYGSDQRHIAGANHGHSVIGKCTFCVHRVEQGLLPACVANCPVGAMRFGDLDDPTSDVSKLLAEKRSWRMKANLNTEPKVFYVGRATPEDTSARQIEAVEAKE